jgi:hypothetical protein
MLRMSLAAMFKATLLAMMRPMNAHVSYLLHPDKMGS